MATSKLCLNLQKTGTTICSRKSGWIPNKLKIENGLKTMVSKTNFCN